MKANDMGRLAQFIGHTLATLIDEHNFSFPIFLTTLSANGNMSYCCYIEAADPNAGYECEFLAQYMANPEGYRLPIRLIFMDGSGSGESALLMITSQGESTLTIQ